jgi:hypothetical protein
MRSNSAFFILPSSLGNWLPDMDLNHDKQIQSLLCYRYTIGQAGAFGKLETLSAQSSRQATSNWICNDDNGVSVSAAGNPLSPGDLSRLGSGERNPAEGGGPRGPSLRERASHWAGVRASVNIIQSVIRYSSF